MVLLSIVVQLYIGYYFITIHMAANEKGYAAPSNCLVSAQMLFVEIGWGADIIHNSYMNNFFFDTTVWATFMSGSSLLYIDTFFYWFDRFLPILAAFYGFTC